MEPFRNVAIKKIVEREKERERGRDRPTEKMRYCPTTRLPIILSAVN
jgi:hypothetical protein